MSSYKNAQHYLKLRGRDFHFVSYDGQPANIKKGEVEVGPMWYLMGPGKRWPVMPQVEGQSDEEIAKGLKNWLIGQGLAGA
jgi:hypothetical protein